MFVGFMLCNHRQGWLQGYVIGGGGGKRKFDQLALVDVEV